MSFFIIDVIGFFVVVLVLVVLYECVIGFYVYLWIYFLY